SRVSLPTRARASGERKEDILERGFRRIDALPQLCKRADRDDRPRAQQQKSIAHACGIAQLMNRQQQRAAPRCFCAQKVRDFARLAQIEAIEWLIEEEKWSRHK